MSQPPAARYPTMPLTDSAIKNAKAKAKPYKIYDDHGLFLLVTPTGGRLWRIKYKFGGKEKLLAPGAYPATKLAAARARRDEARSLLAEGKDPSVEKKRATAVAALSQASTFRVVALELIAKRREEGVSTATHSKAEWFLKLLDRDLGARPIAEIEALELLNVVKLISADGRRETARRLLAFASRVFRYAVATARAKRDPAADLRGALVAPAAKHHAAITEPVAVGALLRAIEGFGGQPATRLALRLAPHVFVRPGELRHAVWAEIDLEAAVWRIPAARMKMKREHVLPLSTQSVAILTEAKQLTGSGRYVFPSVRTSRRPMSENTINAALRGMGYGTDDMTGHGFRSTASTLLNESGKWSTDAIEKALAHKDTDQVRAAYHRGTHWEERVRMAQWWSDYLDILRDGAAIIPFRHAAP